MFENLPDGKFVEAITSTLNSILIPYEDTTPLKHLVRAEFEKYERRIEQIPLEP